MTRLDGAPVASGWLAFANLFSSQALDLSLIHSSASISVEKSSMSSDAPVSQVTRTYQPEPSLSS
jgi:hypothetical protein